jgi:SAM-dependent methyltransferase
MKRELLIGCGNNRNKRLSAAGETAEWSNLTTLDIDPSCNPDVVHDLTVLPLPFKDGEFDEIHAYECLEHTGQQGDWKFFFAQFYEFWRILKHGGILCATVPMWDSPWAWGDPGHTRCIPKESLIFLNQQEYVQVGETSITDYRPVWKGDFESLAIKEGEHQFGFVLGARKTVL